MTAKISVLELQIVIERMFRKLQSDKITEIVFDYDEYWVIPTEEWKVSNHETTPEVGSLVDDIQFLQRVTSKDLPMSYLALERMASVLRATGEELTL